MKFKCNRCGRSFEAKSAPVCTGVGTVEERQEREGIFYLTKLEREHLPVLMTQVKR